MKLVTDWITVKSSDGGAIRLFGACPDGTDALPAVIVLQEAFGVNKHIQAVTERIAALGVFAVAPELFHRSAPAGFEADYTDFASVKPHLAAVTEQGLEADFLAIHKYLREEAKVDAKRLAAIGFCMGGRAAFVANAVLPLRAAISYYGGGLANFLHLAPRQHAPLLFFWGGQDTHIPLEQRNLVHEALRKAGKPFAETEFSDAGHGFFCEDRPSYHPADARYSWALTTEFLADRLELN